VSRRPAPPADGPPAGGPTHDAPPPAGAHPPPPPRPAAARPAASRPPASAASTTPPLAETLLGGPEASLLDLVDHLLDQGVVVTGDVVLGLAGVDLVYLRLSLLLAAADRVLPGMALGGSRPAAAGEGTVSGKGKGGGER
jgi:hypothetical protein